MIVGLPGLGKRNRAVVYRETNDGEEQRVNICAYLKVDVIEIKSVKQREYIYC